MTALGTLPNTFGSTAGGINDAGKIVGSFVRSGAPRGFPRLDRGPERATHAFVWQHGKAYDLNDCLMNGAGWLLTDARGINGRLWA